jgi:hypothetical protein
VWTQDFSPSSDLDLETYLMNRLKNEKKSANRKKMMANQRDRMQSYIEDALSTLNEQGENSQLDTPNLKSEIV